MNTTPPHSHSLPVGDNAIDRLLESLRRKESAVAAPTEEDDLPLLTDIVRAEHASRAPAPAAPPSEEKPAPSAGDHEATAAARTAEAALQALEARVQELPRLIANAVHNALPGITAEVLREIRGQSTED
ncbi:MAG: hypothetical protein LBF51_03940 [Zoogloeaceae bacterium]|jgi:hypothetical protein|nr:hypothetical protein [Zoogloeaceae bacterium]